ncbi:MAG: hypothetical protein K8L99_29895 [Anaerolineae bacterium]|nr:hypothetical protein [Anaerolineae bacterium]
MRLRRLLPLFAVLALFALVPFAQAQNPAIEWTRWDNNITVRSDQNILEVTEIQEIAVTNDSIGFVTRSWTSPVDIQQVFWVPDSGQPQDLAFAQSDSEGAYTVTQSGEETAARFNLPRRVQNGESFVLQINYTAPLENEGIVDWYVIPEDHPFPVLSSQVTINFPDVDAPDIGLARVVSGNGNATQNGNSLMFQSTGTIPAQQPFEIQFPFGAGVGAANGSGNSTQNEPVIPPAQEPEAASPTEPILGFSPDLTTILCLVCVVGVLLLFGGSSLLRSLLGGFLGGGFGSGGVQPRGGGFFPRTPINPRRSNPPTNNPPSQSPSRGFRPSSQPRNTPRVNKKKGGGGSAGIG